MSERGEHGSPVYAEEKGGRWSKWDRYVMDQLGQSEEAWSAMRRAGIAYVEALHAEVRARLGLS